MRKWRRTAAAALACLLAAACDTRACRGVSSDWAAIEAPAPGTAVAPGQEVHFRVAVDGSRTNTYRLAIKGGAQVGRAEGAGIATIPYVIPLEARGRIDFTATVRDTDSGLEATAETWVDVRPTAR
jgi:hypothetical protein